MMRITFTSGLLIAMFSRSPIPVKSLACRKKDHCNPANSHLPNWLCMPHGHNNRNEWVKAYFHGAANWPTLWLAVWFPDCNPAEISSNLMTIIPLAARTKRSYAIL
jgi:hypothetical protein